MEGDIALVSHIYERFNARDIDGVLAALCDDVAWSNGMDGGHVHGHAALREYWTRQWALVSPHVEPKEIARGTDGSIVVDVLQSIRDLDGNPLEGQTHGLKDRMVAHVFHFQKGKVARFDIGDGR
ncbi:ketosteroid isomerase [Aureimonas sp. SA4125]|uniref:nuclear transport factor 2 family protein n=1 Tax=Aureimonas sp. SA4125 TaxID=2826993 RepID=UPI001CC7407C|nr:nuclear transport factor 2 family protein [Aureimonas sp. SA4125]BDA83475.1 ketosteroid isomerase [Aureimonas sp. SA4125]